MFFVCKICRKVMLISIKFNVSFIKVYKKWFNFRFIVLLGGEIMILLDQEITEKNSYKFKEGYLGFKIPIVSDSMFHTMINNENR